MVVKVGMYVGGGFPRATIKSDSRGTLFEGVEKSAPKAMRARWKLRPQSERDEEEMGEKQVIM